MDLSHLQKLHGPCEGANPSGVNLEYDERFLEMMRLSESHPEVQYGKTILPARGPEWKQLADCCLSVASETRDLRVGVLLVESLCRTNQWAGLAAGLELLAAWIVNHWDCLYPRLDVEDDYDPTERLGILSHLVDNELLMQGIQNLPLAEHRTMGRITLRDYNAICSGHALANTHKLSHAEVEVLFSEMEQRQLDDTLRSIEVASAAFASINGFLSEQVGIERWSGAPLVDMLDRVSQILRSQIVTPTFVSTPDCLENDTSNITLTTTSDDATVEEREYVVAQDSQSHSSETMSSRLPMQIASRADATVAIDMICAYFEQHEPASPVPLILQRAKRLIPMSFVEILRELAPNEGHQFLQHLICPD